MPEKSRYSIEIPSKSILDWLFPEDQEASDVPIWIDAEDPKRSLSPRQALQWSKKLGVGLQRLGLKENDVVLIYSTNHIFIPVVYFGSAGNGYIFSGCNPAYGVNGS